MLATLSGADPEGSGSLGVPPDRAPPIARPDLLDPVKAQAAVAVAPFGLPSLDLENVLVRRGFVVGYDRRTRNPSWVCQRLSASASASSASASSASASSASASSASASSAASPDREDGGGGAPLVLPAGDRASVAFHADGAVPPQFRARLEDYAGSGLDRGHVCPAADLKFSQAAVDDSFLLSNVSPQVYVYVLDYLV